MCDAHLIQHTPDFDHQNADMPTVFLKYFQVFTWISSMIRLALTVYARRN